MIVNVFGERRSNVSVNSIDVIEKLINSVVPFNHYISAMNGKYILMETDGNHRPDFVVGELSKEDYEYVQHLKQVITYLYKKHAEEINLKREFETYKKNQSSN